MFNPDKGNLGGKMGWIYAATCLIAIVVVYFEFPETRNRTFIKLDHMFEMRLSSRKFAGFAVPTSTTPTAEWKENPKLWILCVPKTKTSIRSQCKPLVQYEY